MTRQANRTGRDGAETAVDDGGRGDARDGARAAKSGRLRGALVVTLVVITSLAALISTIALSSARTVTNTDVFTRRVTGALDDPDVQAALTRYTTNQVMTAVNADALVQQALPASAQRLAPAVVAGVRNVVSDTVAAVYASSQFQDLLEQLVRRTHEAALKLLKGQSGDVLQVQGNDVVFNVIPIVAEVLRRLGLQGLVDRAAQLPAFGGDEPPSEQVQRLQSALGIQLPPDFGQLTVMTSDSIPRLQDALDIARRVIIVVLVATVLLAALALVLSRHRWRTAAQLGIGISAAMLLALVFLRWAANKVDDAITDPQSRRAVRDIARNFAHTIRVALVLLLIAGVVIAIVAYVAGPSPSARRLRAAVGGSSESAGVPGFVQEHSDAIRVVAIILAGLALYLIGLNLWGVIVAAAIGVGGFALAAAARARHEQGPSVGAGPAAVGGG